MKFCRTMRGLVFVVCSSASLAGIAAPLSLKVSNSKGEAWKYYREANGQWVLEQRSGGSAFNRKPLAKIEHQRVFEDLRRSVTLRKKLLPGGTCLGPRAEVELGGFSKSQTRKLCLERLEDKDFYGRVLARLDEAQGKKGSGRRLFGRQ